MIKLHTLDFNNNPIDNFDLSILLHYKDFTYSHMQKDVPANATFNFYDMDNIPLDMSLVSTITILIKKKGFKSYSHEFDFSGHMAIEARLEEDPLYYSTDTLQYNGTDTTKIWEDSENNLVIETKYTSPFRRLK